MSRRRSVYIVGGGGTLAGFNFSRLRDLDTIAVNVAASDVPNPTYCITADSSVFKKVQDGEFKNVKTTWVLVTNPNHCSMKMKDGVFKNVHTGYIYNLLCMDMIIRNADVNGIGFSFNDFKTGYNSGFCGFQLAVLLGYTEIHLLGFDMTIGKKCHYHNKYHNHKISKHSFGKYLDNFIKALKIIKNETDIQVISHSNISKLNESITYASLESI